MNAKKAKHLRRMLKLQNQPAEYKFVTTPGVLRNGLMVVGLQWKFTYISSGEKAMYKMAKKMERLVEK